MGDHAFLSHGGHYKKLLSYQKSVLVYDTTVVFCDRFFHKYDRTVGQMVQAARSGKQNIVEGCTASTASRETELKLITVARASLEELLEDYRDFLRTRQVELWPRDDARTLAARKLVCDHEENRDRILNHVVAKPPEVVANIIICLIHQTNYLLDRQLFSLEKAFLEHGGLRETMYRARRNSTKK